MNPSLIVSAVAGLISVLVFWVTYQQWLLARHRFRLDLFDRRYRIFEATRKFLSAVMSKADFDDAQFFEFAVAVLDAEFLFDKDVVSYLAEVKTRSFDMRRHSNAAGRLVGPDDRTSDVNAAHNQLAWLGDQITGMKAVFLPYLGFAKIK